MPPFIWRNLIVKQFLEESYYKSYFNLLLPPKCKKLWKTFEENALFSFCSLVSTTSFLIWIKSEQNTVQKMYIYQISYPYTDSQTAPDGRI